MPNHFSTPQMKGKTNKNQQIDRNAFANTIQPFFLSAANRQIEKKLKSSEKQTLSATFS